MFEFPGGLRVVKRRGITGELELLHHLLRLAIFALEQEGHENLELDHLSGLILIAARRLTEQSLKLLARFGVVLFLKWNLRQVVLRLPEFWIGFGRLLERCL